MKSLPIIIRRPVLALLGGLVTLNVSATTYIEPDPSVELFRLEKIPMQVDKMKDLSRHLVVIAKRPNNRTAVQQRATAQLLALAAELDPSNQEARDTNRSLAKGNNISESNEKDLNRALSKIRPFEQWLSQADAGKDANLLSTYLKDALKVLNPATITQNDRADWKKIVPTPDKYPNQHPVKVARREKTREQNNTNHDAPQGDPFDEPKKLSYTELSVKTPCILENWEKYIDRHNFGRERTRRVVTHGISDFRMEFSPSGEASHDWLTLNKVSSKYSSSSNKYDPFIKEITSTIRETINNRHNGLGNYNAKVTISGGSYSRANEMLLSGPLLLMLEASITNKPLKNDLVILANIDTAGNLKADHNFWKSLEALRKSKIEGTLIVPKEAASLVSQVLVFGEPDFFIRWKVYAVNNLDEAMQVSTQSSTRDLREADELFKTVQNLTSKTDVTKLCVNRAVRKRLSEIAEKSHHHLSSRALLLQGSSKRPRHLSPKALGHALLQPVTFMHDNLKLREYEYPSSSKMKEVHETMRKTLDPLERLVDRSNNQLYKSAVDLANDFRSTSLLIRRIRDRDYDDDYDTSRRKIRANYAKMATEAKTLLTETRRIAGLPNPED